MDTPMLEFVIGHANYWLFILLMMTGLYIVIAKGNLVKKNCWSEYLSNLRFHALYFNGENRRRHRADLSFRFES